MKSLTDIQSKAFMAIGPCRIAALSLVALAQENTTHPESEEAAVLKMSVHRITGADTMLKSGLDQLLSDSQYTFPPKLEEMRQECIQVLNPLVSLIAEPQSAIIERVRAKPDFAGHCLFRLEPVISSFLRSLIDILGDEQKTRDHQRETGMKDTITNAESVGRNIQLISFNASIEAARIGDMGKGFAVIASEIRKLSGETQTLLKDMSEYLRH